MTAVHPRIQKVAIILSLAVLLSFVLSAWSFYSGHKAACDSRNTTLSVMRDILMVAQNDSTPSPKASSFYTHAFRRIAEATC